MTVFGVGDDGLAKYSPSNHKNVDIELTPL